VESAIPKIRQGSYFPSILEPRRRSEQALLAMVQQAYVCGVSTRRVDQLVESRVCEALDEHVEAFRTRPLEGRYPLRDVTRSRPTAVGPAIRSQRASDKMRLVW
jgi:putative transposase